MRLRVDDIGFEAPAGLSDRTNYRFTTAQPREDLEVNFEYPAGGGTPSADVIEAVRARLDGIPLGRLTIDEQGEREVAGTGGHFLRYSHDVDGERAQGLVVAANLGSDAHAGDWVKFSWSVSLPLDQVEARVDAVLASVGVAGEAPKRPTPPDWARRQAGRWAFDLPASLEPPRSYRWADVGARVSVSIFVHEPGADEPELDEPLGFASDRGLELCEREDVEPAHDRARDGGKLVHLHLRDEDADSEQLVSRALLGFERGDPVQTWWVEIDASSPWSAADRLRELVRELIHSVREEAP